MLKVPAQILENVLGWYSGNGTLPKIAFSLYTDNKTSFTKFTDRASKGLVANIVSITFTLY